MAEVATVNKENGLNRCPHCGSTAVVPIAKTGKLKCKYCRAQFEGKKTNAAGVSSGMKNKNVAAGAADIIPDESVIMTFKCPACGAEVVINAKETISARCHWCRHHFALNEKMPNGAVPDMVLPFKLEKSDAESRIRAFVEKRQFFAHPRFKKEFKAENVMGVFLPYMVVDVNAHSNLKGVAEIKIRQYTVRTGEHSRTTYYDADAYYVERDFDILVDDLTIEASSDKLNQNVKVNTNNVINAIMPFDTENCVDWNPNFLIGYASERRDTNVGNLDNQIKLQVEDISRYKMYEDMKAIYNRGEAWNSEVTEIKGSSWKAAYLPVWLYSYRQESNGILHYVAVNARTGETMGSVPINKVRLSVISVIIEIIGIILGLLWIYMCLRSFDDDENPFWLGLLGFTPGFLFYWMKTKKYRNMDERHTYEKETRAEVQNLAKKDTLFEHRTRLRNSRIQGENGTRMTGVVASNNEKMMGEKMANFLGIGRSAGSPVNSTPVGAKAEEEVKNKYGK